MGIPILSEIERLISEHGSAAILKERLALASDQYSALEKKLVETNLRNEQLESENSGLRLELEKAQEKIRNLEEKLVERHGQRLDEIKEKILCFLAQHEEISEPHITRDLGLGEPLTKFHLDDLKTAKLINITALMAMTGRPRPPTWRLTQEGRRYLATHGLLA